MDNFGSVIYVIISEHPLNTTSFFTFWLYKRLTMDGVHEGEVMRCTSIYKQVMWVVNQGNKQVMWVVNQGT